MARKLRIQYPGAICHVMNRGDHQERIFCGDDDRKVFLATLAEGCGKTGWQVHSYCLMTSRLSSPCRAAGAWARSGSEPRCLHTSRRSGESGIMARSPQWLGANRLLVDGISANDAKGLLELDLEKQALRSLLNEDVDCVVLSPDKRFLACIVQKRRVARFFGEPESFYNIALVELTSGRLESIGPTTSFQPWLGGEGL